jgi:hypothetical protein
MVISVIRVQIVCKDVSGKFRFYHATCKAATSLNKEMSCAAVTT